MSRMYGGVDRRTVDAVTSRPFGATSGRAWFVDGTNGSTSGSGNSETPFSTIAAAISASTANVGDVIVVAPGTYTITAALAPKAGTSIIAGVVGNPRVPTVTITGAIDLLEIDVDNTRFENIKFLASDNAVATLVDIADTAAVAGASFYQCVFDGADKTSVVGISAVDGTFAASFLHVEDCLFKDLTGTMINVGVLGMAYSCIRNNVFAHDINSGIGIALADTSAFVTGKGYTITDNIFLPFDATGDEVGISIAGTENTTGAGIIARNMFSYGAAATSITQDKLSLSEVNNYTGDAATGGTIIDPGT